MKSLVTVTFVRGQQEAIAARLPAEQEHVRGLLQEGVIEAIYIAADRSRVWLVMPGDSPEQVRRTMTAFPLFPYMELGVTPLLEAAPAR